MHVADFQRWPGTPAKDLLDSLRGAVAGNIASKLTGSAAVLFEAGGRHLLATEARQGLVAAAASVTSRALSPATAGANLLANFAAPVAKGLGRAEVSAVAGQGVRLATKSVLRGAGRAAGIGFVIDGAMATAEAVVAVRRGDLDRKAAVEHVVKEAASGAVATGAGVLLGTGLVAVTGGLAAPVVFVVAAVGSIGAKRIARRALG